MGSRTHTYAYARVIALGRKLSRIRIKMPGRFSLQHESTALWENSWQEDRAIKSACVRLFLSLHADCVCVCVACALSAELKHTHTRSQWVVVGERRPFSLLITCSLSRTRRDACCALCNCFMIAAISITALHSMYDVQLRCRQGARSEKWRAAQTDVNLE